MGTAEGLLDETRGKLNSLHIETIGQQAERLLTDLSETNRKLLTLLAEFDATPLNETLSNARQATEHLNDVLMSLKEYPSGFLFGQPPPPARSVTGGKK